MHARQATSEATPIHYKNTDELAIMQEAGRINAQALQAMKAAIEPGISTAELDSIAASVLRAHNAIPAFLNYPPDGPHPFPATITASINNELVHGIPSPDRVLQAGDIISLDCGTIFEGFVGDSAITVAVGEISPAVQRLVEITEQAFWAGAALCKPGYETSDVSRAVQKFIESSGYDVVREYTGHGVGHTMHEPPQVPNWWPRRARRRGWQSVPLKPGLTFALEPMVVAGRAEMKTLDDHWTVVTKDGSLCSHYEHTIAITEDEPLILTKWAENGA